MTILRQIGLAVAICIGLASSPLPMAYAAATSAPQHTQPSTAHAAYTLPPAQLARAVTLTHIRTALALTSPAWMLLVLLLALAWRWPVHLRNWVERMSPRHWLQSLIFLPLAILFIVLVPLPLQIYGHHIGRAYGLSVQTWGSWTADWIKTLLLSLLAFFPLLLLLFLLIRHSPRRWWLWFWLCTIPVIVFGVFISPLLIDPVFNHFSPLEKSDPQLVVQLERLIEHAGLEIPPSRMFLMQASDKVTGFNAYVTGIGASKRIVVWDNTIRELPPDEILFIVGHETGHYVLHHIYKGLAFTALLLLVLLWFAYLSSTWLMRRYGARWGIRGLNDWAALAVLVIVFTCLNFLSSPIVNSFSRWEEHQADIYGQEAIHGLVANPQQTAERAFTALGTAYLEAPNPNPLIEFWFNSHPSTSRRFRFAEHYNPWLPGRHPRYFSK